MREPSPVRHALAAVLLLAARIACAATPEAAPPPEPPNSGQDPTRPITRLEFRYQFENLPGADGGTGSWFIFRGDQKLTLSEHWQAALRLDVPVEVTNAVGTDDPTGTTMGGMSDLLTQAILIYTIDHDWAVGAGSQFTFPTATLDTTGSGKWEALPTAAFRRHLPVLGAGSFFVGLVRYDFDMGGDPDRSHISELQIQPQLEWRVTEQLYVDTFPSSDIRVNLGPPKGQGRLFFPADVLVGWMWTPRFITEVEVSAPIVKQFPVYDFKLVTRIGVFFD